MTHTQLLMCAQMSLSNYYILIEIMYQIHLLEGSSFSMMKRKNTWWWLPCLFKWTTWLLRHTHSFSIYYNPLSSLLISPKFHLLSLKTRKKTRIQRNGSIFELSPDSRSPRNNGFSLPSMVWFCDPNTGSSTIACSRSISHCPFESSYPREARQWT